MWIAQGFVQSATSNRDIEDVANSYFMDLLRRSFIQETEEHKSLSHCYKMHDLIHDLAKEVADKEFFSITKTEDTEMVLPEQTFHVFCLSVPPSPFYRKHMKLRTFICLNDYGFISNSTLERMISGFECLRVLYLCRTQINSLPQSLGELKHLRYLAISCESIAALPNSITTLHNLQVLKLINCSKLKKLPRDIWRLVSLRSLVCQGCNSFMHIPPRLWRLTGLMHVDFDDCFSLEDMPPGISQLTSLRTLKRFIVGKESCESGMASDRLNEVKGLVDLRDRLSIKFMGQALGIGEKRPADVVKRMKHLHKLFIEFEYGNHGDDTEADLILLEALQPHRNLKSLRIEIFGGSRFPRWLMVDVGFVLPKLVNLYIGDCRKCKKLPPLWQLPSLQTLVLWNLDFTEHIYDDKVVLPSTSPTNECCFPSLKRLALGMTSEVILKQILCPPHHPSPLCNITNLTLCSVEDLASMPEDVFKNLTSLQSLSIKDSRDVVSLSRCLTHLTSLGVLCVENISLNLKCLAEQQSNLNCRGVYQFSDFSDLTS